ncbi:ATPase, T2SS/T4P/T4SS family [Bordetella petrii]|uniref:ATPase, T2SS/T4P/T4SS family n=1 Tax=Bordetella petrii TaxID=94624 RepID=UPI001E5E7964|nr:ATPase, T2SS/T4P/T4SS family [Bordetella petrii]MCD0501640.1 Flp pilus assembly complex ATPase component TadA [Bordetella petrii]
MTILDILMTFEDGQQRSLRATAPVLIGRSAECGLRIPNWRVAKRHAQLVGQGGSLELEDLGSLGGTLVNGRRVTVHRPLMPDDDIVIGPCRLRVSTVDNASEHPSASSEAHGSSAEEAGAISLAAPEGAPQAVAGLLPHRRRLHAALLQALDLRRRDVAGMSDTLLRAEAQRLLEDIAASDADIPAHADRAALCREVLDEAVGLGPLEPLLADPGISEIMVNRHDEIYVERRGRLCRHEAAFSSEQSVRWVIERIVAPLGRRIDESAPMVDARLPDGSRVNAVIPPVALKGPALTIRKFPALRPCMADLVRGGSIDAAMAEFLALCVRTRKSVVVSGGTGSGKTTLLNILSNAIPEGERIVTIEDAAELRLDHAHLVALEARPANLQNRGRIDIRDLVRNALRMRPDRIVVGECRGAEAFDMLTAMNTGHDGSLTTLHANSPRDALGRLEAMVLMAGMDLPLTVVREHIGASIDIIVQQTRLSDGRRIVASIVEITGLESGRIQLQELFRYQAGQGFLGCGVLPSFAQAWQLAGVAFDAGMFSGAAPLAATRGLLS